VTTIIGNGQTQNVSGFLAIDEIVQSGGDVEVGVTGEAAVVTINGGGVERVNGGLAAYTTVQGSANAGGGGWNALLQVNSGSAEYTTLNSDGAMYVYNQGFAEFTTVNNGGFADDGGLMWSTTVNSGGLMIVQSNAAAGDTTIQQGGIAWVESLPAANVGTGNVGGGMVSSGGVLVGTVVDNGRLNYDVGSGNNTFGGDLSGSGTLAVMSVANKVWGGGGTLVITSALNNNVSLDIDNLDGYAPAPGYDFQNPGMTLELQKASNNKVTFLGGNNTLRLDDSREFTGTVAGLAHNTVDLVDMTYLGGLTKLSFSENAAGTGGTLTLSDPNGLAVNLNLLGQFSAAGFRLSGDGIGQGFTGTAITYDPNFIIPHVPSTHTPTHLAAPMS
jgi:autotransporter passenger strand-loop-strand repeat protein